MMFVNNIIACVTHSITVVGLDVFGAASVFHGTCAHLIHSPQFSVCAAFQWLGSTTCISVGSQWLGSTTVKMSDHVTAEATSATI